VYLIDTNIWLERLLDQDRSAEVGEFLDRVANDRLYLTDFTLHSIGIVLTKLDHAQTFSRFVKDVLIDGAVHLIALRSEDMTSVTDPRKGINSISMTPISTLPAASSV
jgi:predicted nucleic acid-binding protein